MSKIDGNTKVVDIENLKPYAKWLMYKVVPVDKPAVEMTLNELRDNQPTWPVESMIRGLTRLDELAAQGNIMYDVYTDEECADDPEKKDVKVFFMPAKQQPSDKPFIICASGGAYTCVCSVVESIPTAARFNELGYNVFVLNYRVMQDPLFPHPQDDLAAAVKYIQTNKEAFGLHNSEYIINGFSAGGSLVTIFGTEEKGWKKYGLSAPKAVFGIYPSISSEYLEEGPMKDWFLSMMFGQNYDMETVRAYDVPKLFTENYPPCFITQAEDDPTVPCRHAIELKRLCDEHHIPAKLELVESGGHGWGDGCGTDAAGWPDRAIEFVESLA